MAHWRHNALDMAPKRLLDHSTGFRRQLRDQDTSPSQVLERFHRTLHRHWKTLSDDEKRNIFAFAEWCVRQFDPELHDAARDAFYAPLFDDRERDWADIAPWLSPYVIEQSWSLWSARLDVDDLARLQAIIETRTDTRYALILVATQKVDCTFPRRPPLPDCRLEVTMQMDYPGFSAGIGTHWTNWKVASIYDEAWGVELSEYIFRGVWEGLVTVEEPLPDKGLDFEVAFGATADHGDDACRRGSTGRRDTVRPHRQSRRVAMARHPGPRSHPTERPIRNVLARFLAGNGS